MSRYIKAGHQATVAEVGFDSLEWLLKRLSADRQRTRSSPSRSRSGGLTHIGRRILLWFAEQEANMLRHDYMALNVESVTAPHPFQG